MTFTRTSLVAGAAIVLSIGNAALFAPTASAAGNTWIRSSTTGYCITAAPNGSVSGQACRSGDLTQLWARVGSQIKRAYANQCLDSNANGNVYWLECNGGNYQNWDYQTSGQYILAKNRQTGNWLYSIPNSTTIIATSRTADYWCFSGGE
ncbi:ricin-type beta-trefoil lectin domain protein [Streptomyces niveiscabiei]|uniref:RICIN domain-containing protein n=1 Tax=Streptomyces niveiscabiei TaxID=164115 RepID=UPI0029A921B7|nr:ricin-type beta-trefoil lectin domain protein [Streptomyces niveiscabiei]MDX3387428.1 ricin-type beta-trefoil lectin domain protein [Streptomyces niveiscabiei]